LTGRQEEVLQAYAHKTSHIPLRDATPVDRVFAGASALRQILPYHSAVLLRSLASRPDVARLILRHQGPVFTSVGHWGTLVYRKPAKNWILNQCDADIEFWRVYAKSASGAARWAASVNYRLAARMYPSVYRNVGGIISVCEEDLQCTKAVAPQAMVAVVENGVDCTYFQPRGVISRIPGRLVFTGTSAARNVRALRVFIEAVLPLVRREVPHVTLLVAGDFQPGVVSEFSEYPDVSFSGRVHDIRPCFETAEVFVAPFEETHGSKVKVAQALAMGMAIVSTPAGVRGLPVKDGHEVIIARDKYEFADSVSRLIRNNRLREELGRAGREAATARLDWTILGSRLRRVVAPFYSETPYTGGPR